MRRQHRIFPSVGGGCTVPFPEDKSAMTEAPLKRFLESLNYLLDLLPDAESAAVGDEFVRDSSYIARPSWLHKFEFSFLNPNLMAPPGRQLIFLRAARCCAPQKRCRSTQT
jgi:hypothetical protein